MLRYIPLLLITACSMSAYQPHLTSEPVNQDKYESDRQACITEATNRGKKAIQDNRMNNLAIGIFGPIAIPSAIAEGTPDYNKSGYEMADECMIKRGYNLN